MRVDPNKGVLENVALGVRNSVGFDCIPRPRSCGSPTHGRDWLGDNSPERHAAPGCEEGSSFRLSLLPPGRHARPEFGKNRSCSEFTRRR